jgi:hypothetical protein
MPGDGYPLPVLVRRNCDIHTYGDEAARWLVFTPWRAWAMLCTACRDQIGGLPVLPLEEVPAREPLISEQEARDYCAAQRWKFARSMPEWPHEYVLLNPGRQPGHSTDPWMHLRVVAFIRAVGQKRWFAPSRRLHAYWQPGDGTEVWTLRPVDTILNRQHLEGPQDWQEWLPL